MYSYQPFKGQNFYKLRDECLANGKQFIDDKFPVSHKSNIKWCRPFQLCSNPQFFVAGASRFDVNQGKLGDCWLLAAMASLTLHENLFNTVVCKDNSDFEANYCGIFHFRFWNFGKFIDVVVDDRLPTENGKDLIYAKSTEKNEFWSALLEKAYAKLYGGYSNIVGGFSSEAYVDFTGGVTEIYDLKHVPVKVFDFIKKSINRNVFFMCAIMQPKVYHKQAGLVDWHAYSITGVTTVKSGPNKPINLLRIRNPWGTKEWNGKWSDKSAEWRSLSNAERTRIGLTIEDDGEFWMSFEDFKKYFDTLDICNVHPDIEMRQPHPSRKWNLMSFDGSFGDDLTHTVNFTDPDLDDDEDFCTVVIALMQKHTRKRNQENTPINFNIIASDGTVVESTSHGKRDLDMREVCHRFELKPGKYHIMPRCGHNSDNEYLLRIFYETKKHVPTRSYYDECNEQMRQLQISNENKRVETVKYVPNVREPEVHSYKNLRADLNQLTAIQTKNQVPKQAYRPVQRNDDCGCCIIM